MGVSRQASFDSMNRAEEQSQLRELLQAGYRYALSLSHHHHDAEDLVQQAWMQCASRYGKPDKRSLLYTTIRNLFYDRCRRGKIVSFEPIPEDTEFPDPSNLENSVGNSRDLDVLLTTLRAEEREALFLNAVEGRTAKEIAEMTGSSRNSILSLIHRARKKLTRLVAEENPLKFTSSSKKQSPNE